MFENTFIFFPNFDLANPLIGDFGKEQFQRYTIQKLHGIRALGLCKIIFIAPKEFKDPKSRPDLMYVCMCSVFHRRGTEPKHPTSSMDPVKLAELPLFFNRELVIHPSAVLIEMLNLQRSPQLTYDQEIMKNLLSKKQSMSQEILEAFRLEDPKHVKDISDHFHRNVSELALEMAKVYSNFSKQDLPSNGSYIAAVLQTEDSSRLLASCHPPEKWKSHGTHCTLMHSFDFSADPEKWKKNSQLLGRQVVFQDIQLLKRDQLYVAKVTFLLLNDETSETNNSKAEANQEAHKYVFAGVPHITLATDPSIQAKQSITFLKESKPEDFTPLSFQPPLLGTIQLISFD